MYRYRRTRQLYFWGGRTSVALTEIMKMAEPSFVLPYETLPAYVWEISSLLEVYIGMSERETASIQQGSTILHRDLTPF